jgi:aryl-alcohol dehydrogenase-like predicted oxidoreductase
MERIELAPGLAVSRLGFGCASVMGRKGRRESEQALGAVFGAGISHFDVARAYGFGEAEKLLGGFAAGRRQEMTIASKFGIAATTPGAVQRLLKPLVRTAVGLLPGLGKVVTATARRTLVKGDYDAATARASLLTSLEMLGTDYLDIAFFHEPPARLEGAGATIDVLEAMKQDGSIRAWGLSGTVAEIASLAPSLPREPDILQFDCALFDPCYDRLLSGFRDRPILICAPFGGRGAATALARLNTVLPMDRARFHEFTLRKILDDFPRAAIVCSAFTPAHIRANAAIAAGAPPDDPAAYAAFEKAVAAVSA